MRPDENAEKKIIKFAKITPVTKYIIFSNIEKSYISLIYFTKI